MDVVRLKDGSEYRGTIAENVPGSHVVIVLVSGAVRQLPAADIAYAGPAHAAAEPPPAPPAPAAQSEWNGNAAGGYRPRVLIHGPVAELDIGSEIPELTLYVEDDRAVGSHGARATGYERICTLPCRASMPAGTHQFAFQRGKKDPRPFEEPTTLAPGPQRADVLYESRSLLRGIGWVVLVGGSLGGLLLVGAGSEDNPDTGESDFNTLGYVGVGVFAASLTAGLVMVLTKDRVELQVAPQQHR